MIKKLKRVRPPLPAVQLRHYQRGGKGAPEPEAGRAQSHPLPHLPEGGGGIRQPHVLAGQLVSTKCEGKSAYLLSIGRKSKLMTKI